MKVRSISQILLPAAVLLLGLLVLEGVGRTYMHFRYGVEGKSYGRWRSDPILGARMAEDVYDHRWSTNDRGFRNLEDLIDPKPPDAWRIIAYGGSTTLCWNLTTEESWPARLEWRLRAATGNRSHQVLNAGDILWSIGHIYARAKTDIPQLRPDFVLIYSGINEVSNALFLEQEGLSLGERIETGEYGAFSRRLPQNSWLVRNSIVYKVMNKYLLIPLAKHWRDPESALWARRLQTEIDKDHPAIPPDPVIMENYKRVLREMIDLCRGQGAEPIFIVQSRGLRTIGLDHFVSYSREGGRLASEMGVKVVDAQEMVDGYPGDPIDLFYASGIHYSAKGADRFAGWIAEKGFDCARLESMRGLR